MSSREPEFEEKVESHTELTEPPQYKVLLHNDNYTTMDFVVQVLETVFNKAPSEAIQIMLNVHKKNIGVCGIYTFEVAETKVDMVQRLATECSFPLKCSMEEL